MNKIKSLKLVYSVNSDRIYAQFWSVHIRFNFSYRSFCYAIKRGILTGQVALASYDSPFLLSRFRFVVFSDTLVTAAIFNVIRLLVVVACSRLVGVESVDELCHVSFTYLIGVLF